MLKNKRFLASALTAAMVLTMAPSAALATDDPEEKGTSTEETTYEAAPKAQVAENGETKGEELQGNPEQENENPDGNANKDENMGQDSGETPDETGGETKDPDKGTTEENPDGSGETGKPEEPSYVAKNVDTAATYDTLTEALANAEAGNTVELAQNTQENIKIDKSVTIDLGGYTLTGTGEGTVVKISGENLDVTVENGTITGGNTTYSGGGFDIQSGKVTVENCTVEKNQAKIAGGGFNISGSADVKIIDCKVNDNQVSGSSGGAIYQASGAVKNQYYDSVCEIIDTKLENNRAMVGGAVGMGASLFHNGITNANGGIGVTATFIMSGDSEITGNTASYRGGAVYLTGNGSRFQMKDGTISDNVVDKYEGGAIWATNYGGVTIDQGTIRNNKAGTYGGAIYIKGNISDTNDSAKLAVETGLRDVLNLGDVLVTGNSAKQGGGIYIDSYPTAFGVKADLREASIYDNHASVKSDDIGSSGAGTEGCIVQLGNISSDWKLSCGDSVDNWYMDGMEKDENQTVKRWNAHTDQGAIYVNEYAERENLSGILALKAAHGLVYRVNYEVTGDIPEGYIAPAGQTLEANAKYTVAAVPASVSGTKDGVNGTYTFTGWKTKDDKTLTGEQTLTEDITLYGVWTFTKKSSGGHGGGGGKKPTVDIPDDVPTGLDGDNHFAYIIGRDDGKVHPEAQITRAEVATIFFRLLTEETRTANSTKANGYADVSSDRWYNHAISTLSKMGIIKGTPNGNFNPNASITRAEFAAIAARFDDKNTDTSSDFSDILSHWAKDEIGIAANKGWVNGYTDGTFRPNQYITRAEAMTLVNRVLNRLPEKTEDLHKDMIQWPDNQNTAAWYYLAVQEATNSHDCQLKDKESKYETWTKLNDVKKWAELEH